MCLYRSLGVLQVSSSRDSTFVDDTAMAGGVDVILNSMTSPGLVAGSLATMLAGGRCFPIATLLYLEYPEWSNVEMKWI